MKKTKLSLLFDAQNFLDSTGVARKLVEYQRKATIFVQGASSKHVMYIQKGGVKVSVVNEVGKEAIVAVLGPGRCTTRLKWQRRAINYSFPGPRIKTNKEHGWRGQSQLSF